MSERDRVLSRRMSKKVKEIEERLGLSVVEALPYWRHMQGFTNKQVGERLGLGRTQTQRWINIFDPEPLTADELRQHKPQLGQTAHMLTPGVIAKRGATLSGHAQTDPAFAQAMFERTRTYERQAKRMRESLGDDPKHALEEMRKGKMSSRRIAENLRRDQQTILRWLKAAGVNIPVREKLSAQERKRQGDIFRRMLGGRQILQELVNNGITDGEIARSFSTHKFQLDSRVVRDVRRGFKVFVRGKKNSLDVTWHTPQSVRRNMLQASLSEYSASTGLYEVSSVEALIPVLKEITKTYLPFAVLDKDELEAEIMLIASASFSAGKLVLGPDLVDDLHRNIERVISSRAGERRKESSLTAPRSDGLNIEGSIGQSEDEQDKLGEEWIRLLAQLEYNQRQIVIGIAVEEKSMFDMAQETGLDIDIVQALYKEGLDVLKKSLTSNSE